MPPLVEGYPSPSELGIHLVPGWLGLDVMAVSLSLHPSHNNSFFSMDLHKASPMMKK
jgi:hypothetical protein